ncbi:Uncharacterised protein [Capnocytophaga canimorsus]|nr:Uncharacterised protein [Capnocytophaga canimorsus]
MITFDLAGKKPTMQRYDLFFFLKPFRKIKLECYTQSPSTFFMSQIYKTNVRILQKSHLRYNRHPLLSS